MRAMAATAAAQSAAADAATAHTRTRRVRGCTHGPAAGVVDAGREEGGCEQGDTGTAGRGRGVVGAGAEVNRPARVRAREWWGTAVNRDGTRAGGGGGGRETATACSAARRDTTTHTHTRNAVARAVTERGGPPCDTPEGAGTRVAPGWPDKTPAAATWCAVSSPTPPLLRVVADALQPGAGGTQLNCVGILHGHWTTSTLFEI